jgi:hypothetical protein
MVHRAALGAAGRLLLAEHDQHVRELDDLRPATVIGVPPSVSPKNFRLAGMLVTLRWWWPYATGASLAASSCAALGDAATNRHSARALQVSLRVHMPP